MFPEAGSLPGGAAAPPGSRDGSAAEAAIKVPRRPVEPSVPQAGTAGLPGVPERGAAAVRTPAGPTRVSRR
ncbi:hypothetical protein QFZ58_003568 [Streptomyces sp. B1I3]|nr:hypothetical protein [Streptomyces sp. B1I3]